MPVTLIVNNIPIEYPIPGDSPGWGPGATDWATQVTAALNNLQGLTDIPQKTFTINNNISTFTNITGLNFNTGLVRAGFIEYSVYRTSTSDPSGKAEAGYMLVVYDNLAGAGSKWQVVGGLIPGNSEVTFTITDAGQFQYKSSDLGTGHVGNMHFRARTLNQ
jgi:hypothetical protein